MLVEEDINICRSLFGAPGERTFSLIERLFYLQVNKPIWCDKSDELFALFENKKKVIHYGNIVWGNIVQANTLLFEQGSSDCPASVIFSPDPNVDLSFEQLSSAASDMFELKNTTPDDERLRKIADTLTNEMERTFGVNVPKEFCPEFQLYEASTFISRKHLPNRILSKGVLPLLVSPRKPFWCLPLPSKYWPQSLIEYWQD